MGMMLMSIDYNEYKSMRLSVENFRDFIEWLFDEEIDYMTQGEAWDKFEKFQKEKYDIQR